MKWPKCSAFQAAKEQAASSWELRGESGEIPHLAKKERDAPNFLYAALDRTACAALFKESRKKFREPTTPHRKSGMWGTR
jgi:hypothetical protein